MQKERTQAALVAWLIEGSEQRLVYIGWEDLHWADPSTLELVDLLLSQVPTTRLLVLLTFRPQFVPPWGTHSYLSLLTLSRLGQPQVSAMVERVTGGKPLPREVVEQIVTKTDGVPLFVEELTKMVLESDLVRVVNDHYELRGPLPPLAIPSTLQDSLMARLDRLAPVREIAQLGAMLGREFTYTLLHAVSPLGEDGLQQGLKQLVEAELVYQRGLPPEARYMFKHALIQETAYESLLKSTRQQLHQQVAQVLEQQFAETVETQPELVAHHYTEAGLGAQAIPYWQQAGQRAAQRSAHTEAINHLTTGLTLLQALPETPARTQQELTLQVTLVASLMATQGFAAVEAGEVFRRARALCQQLGDSPQLLPVLHGLWASYLIGGQLQPSRELAEQMVRLANEAGDPAMQMGAHYCLGTSLTLMAELTAARRHLEQAISLYDLEQHGSLVQVYGYDPGIASLAPESFTLWLLGYPAQALQQSQAAIDLAQKLSHPETLVMVVERATWVHQFRREASAAQEQAEVVLALAAEHGFVLFSALGTICRGWALAEQDQREEGIALMQQGLAAKHKTGAASENTRLLPLLGRSAGQGGAYRRWDGLAQGRSECGEHDRGAVV